VLNRLKVRLFNALLKIIEETVSVKIHLIIIATIALFYGKIEGTQWASIITALGLGRVLIDSIVANKAAGKPDESKDNPDV